MKNGMYIAAATLLLAPLASFAATYDYVDTTGTVRAVSANSAAAALAGAPNIDAHSGVAVDNGNRVTGTSTGTVTSGNTGSGSVLGASSDRYHYVDTNGVVEAVTASSALQALSLATNIDAHSGVAVDAGLLQDGVSVANQ